MRIAIIGGGATGVMAAIHLLRQFSKQVSLTIFEPSSELGRGLAYSFREPKFLLNVPMVNMSLFSSEPLDFESWCWDLKGKGNIQIEFADLPFVPRFLFGNYLQEQLEYWQNSTGNKIRWIQKKILSVESLELEASSFDHIIVATGFKPTLPIPKELAAICESSRISQPFLEETFHGLQGNETILIVGSGLTAIDVYRKLKYRQHRGPLYFLSRRGLWPLVHPDPLMPVTHSSDLENLLNKKNLSPRLLLEGVRQIFRMGFSYPSLAIQIRPMVTLIWKSWTSFQKRQFLRHLKPYWEVIRHRVPSTVFEELNQDLVNGKCQLIRGRIFSAAEKGSQIMVEVQRIKGNSIISVEKVILATGHSVSEVIPFFEELKLRENVYFLGPISKAENWEVTAIPDIRDQIEKMVTGIQKLNEKES